MVYEMPVLTTSNSEAEGHPPEGDRGHDGLKKGSRADPTRTRLALARSQLYHDQGYDLAEVDLVEGQCRRYQVVIQIFEGPKVKISGIHFVGCQLPRRPRCGPISPRDSRSWGSSASIIGHARRRPAEAHRLFQKLGFFEVKVTPVTRPGKNLGEVT